MSRRFSLLAFVGAAAVVAAISAGYSGSARSAASVSPLPSSSCGPVIYKGSGSPDFIVASDLPLQGAGRAQTVQLSRAELWALANAGWKAGSYKIGYQSCDDSTAQTGGWDAAKCATNAHLYATNKSVIGVIGTFNRKPGGAARLGQSREHKPGPDEEVGRRRAGQVLPDRRAQLRPCRRDRRHPGPG